MTGKIAPLTSSFLAERDTAVATLGYYDTKLFDRIHYIIQAIYKEFDQGNSGWYFEGAEEGEVGDFDKQGCGDELYITLTNYISTGLTIITNAGKFWNLCDSIPRRWLTEDFEEELKVGHELYLKDKENKRALSKEKQLAKKQRKVELDKAREASIDIINNLKAKLTPEELAALNFYKK